MARAFFRELANGYFALTGRTVDFAPQPLGRHIDADGLGGYYCDLRHKALHAIDGMPSDNSGEADHWAIPIAQAALGFWELRIEGQDTDRHFLNLADWLMNRCTPRAGGVVWEIDREVPKYGMRKGWVSAMAQGQAMSVLLRAHALTGSDEYLTTAQKALPALDTPVEDGGCKNEIDGAHVLEEYPTAQPSAVLNGWIFALFGVHELAVETGDPKARALFDRSVEGLIELLPRYDIGWWSLYSLYDHDGRPDLAKPFYQRLHPTMLDGLALIRPTSILESYANRWREQVTRRALARVSLEKLSFRLHRARTEGRKRGAQATD